MGEMRGLKAVLRERARLVQVEEVAVGWWRQSTERLQVTGFLELLENL